MAEQQNRTIQMVDVVGQYRRYQSEIDSAISGILTSGAFINGPAVKQFERNMEAFLGVRHAIGCASGTDALQIALMTVGIKPGDEVITTPFTFVATTETIALLGAKPVYVDIDPDTFNINVEEIEQRITPRTKAILPVHLFGQPANITRIMEIADAHNIYVIEDAAQAIGASWDGKKVCTFGDLSCISFYPSKNLGAYGDGGMIVSNNDKLAETARSVCNHGASVTYHHDRLGVNSRLDSVQAAVLDVKLKYLDEWNARRREIAAVYSECFATYPEIIKTPVIDHRAEHIWHQYSIVVRSNRDDVHSSLKKKGIPTAIYYPIPLHLQPAYSSYGGKHGDFPNAEFASAHILSLPMHAELTDEDTEYISSKIIDVVQGAAG
ncbi:MAG TPA: DegT/DnrJ/EryC1/StrS family aminotransferase [Candidatus Kapabacteria bacterium]|nr:DegT/DnrJ/EryC1/StrS family aminotransferase [Candidatus Kapabacteria bacterium]